MDYQETLKMLQQGSSSQRKRKVWLDKQKRTLLIKREKAENTKQKNNEKNNEKGGEELQQCIDNQLRWSVKIKQGIGNSKRTLLIRFWFAQMFQRKCVADFQKVVDLIGAFEQWLNSYEDIIQEKDLKKEEMENARILLFCKKMEKQKNALLAAVQKCAEERENAERASFVFLALLLTTIILLFKESKEIPFDPTMFEAKNRYNPLNAFFPFRF